MSKAIINQLKDKAFLAVLFFLLAGKVHAQRVMENLGRGLVAIKQPDGKVYLSWRLLGTDPDNIAFNIYKEVDGKEARLNSASLIEGTNFVDEKADDCWSNNGTKSTPSLSADILGDWREELILRSADNKELRIYTTTIPTKKRLYTLMHDPLYRLAVAWQYVGYNQQPMLVFTSAMICALRQNPILS